MNCAYCSQVYLLFYNTEHESWLFYKHKVSVLMHKHHGDEQSRTSQNSWFYESLNKRIQYFPNTGTPNVSGGIKESRVRTRPFLLQ